MSRRVLPWNRSLIAESISAAISSAARVPRVGLHFVRLVPVVEPVAVDEAVLQSRERNAGAARLERERAAPAARFRIRDGYVGLQRSQRRGRFVHRTRRPRELEQRDACELLADERPAVDAADDGVAAQVGAVPQVPPRLVPRSVPGRPAPG